MGELGLWACRAGRMGRRGHRLRVLCAGADEIAAADGAPSTIMSVHNSWSACRPARWHGEQKERFLRPLASGEMLGAFCLTEPRRRSDAAAITHARAARSATSWVLNGTKQFITSGKHARTRDRLRGHRSRSRQEGHLALPRADRHARLFVARVEQSSASTPPTPRRSCSKTAESRPT